MRYELADCEWIAIKPLLPNEPRGVPRVNDRRVLNGILHAVTPPHGGDHLFSKAIAQKLIHSARKATPPPMAS